MGEQTGRFRRVAPEARARIELSLANPQTHTSPTINDPQKDNTLSPVKITCCYGANCLLIKNPLEIMSEGSRTATPDICTIVYASKIYPFSPHYYYRPVNLLADHTKVTAKLRTPTGQIPDSQAILKTYFPQKCIDRSRPPRPVYYDLLPCL